MPLNGLGNYVLPAGSLAVTGTVVASANYNAFLSDLESVLNTVRTVAQGGTGGNSVVTAQQSLNLEPGVDIQPYNLNLQALAGLTGSANRIAYFDGANSMQIANFTSTGRILVAVSSFEVARERMDVPSNAEAMLVDNIGTSANNYVQLDANAKLPAVDGSNLTNVSSLKNVWTISNTFSPSTSDRVIATRTGVTCEAGDIIECPNAQQVQIIEGNNVVGTTWRLALYYNGAQVTSLAVGRVFSGGTFAPDYNAAGGTFTVPAAGDHDFEIRFIKTTGGSASSTMGVSVNGAIKQYKSSGAF